MGRGSAYQYPHHILLNPDDLYSVEDPDDYDQDEADDAWDALKDSICEAFGATRLYSEKYEGRENCLWAETDRLYIGFDSSGGLTCLYLKPKCWNRLYHENGYPYEEEIEYILNRDAAKGFNRLIRDYPTLFCYWTTAWTSAPYGGDVKYTRKG